MIEQMVLIGLAAWRVAASISYERGPFDVFLRFRELLGFEHKENGEPESWPGNPFAKMVSCVWCLGLWTAVALWGLWELEPIAVMVIAASSIVVVVERWNHL